MSRSSRKLMLKKAQESYWKAIAQEQCMLGTTYALSDVCSPRTHHSDPLLSFRIIFFQEFKVMFFHLTIGADNFQAVFIDDGRNRAHYTHQGQRRAQ